MLKKIFSLLLAIILVAMCVPTASAAMKEADSKDTIYYSIFNDYVLITGLSKSEADQYYHDVKKNGFHEAASSEIENIIYGKKINAKYEDHVLYIQDHYKKIVNGLTPEEKALIDKYFLNYAIKYYEDYESQNDFKLSIKSVKSLKEIEPVLIDNEEFEEIYVDENEVILEEAPSNTPNNSSKVATIRIFADPSPLSVGGSGFMIGVGSHAFIAVTNISNSHIKVGKFRIAPGKTVTLGTWGTRSEHIGLWYNLESYFIKKHGAYSSRVSLRADISAENLSVLNSHIEGYDTWSITNNCSSFAVTSWNKISLTKLSAGVVNTPKALANSIKSVSGYSTGFPIPHDYKVYYSQRSNTPKLSSKYN